MTLFRGTFISSVTLISTELHYCLQRYINEYSVTLTPIELHKPPQGYINLYSFHNITLALCTLH